MADFLFFGLANLMVSIGNCIVFFYTGKVLLNMKIRRKGFFKAILPFHFLYLILLTFFSYKMLTITDTTTLFIFYSLSVALQHGTYIIFLKKYLPNHTWRATWLLLTIPSTLLLFFNDFVLYLYLTFGDILRTTNGPLNHYIATIMGFIFTLMALFIWGKTQLAKWVRYLFNYPRLAFLLSCFLYLLEVAQYLLQAQFIDEYSLIYWLLPAFSLILFFTISFVAREVDRNNRLTHSEEMLAQQQLYIEHVELLYRQLRKTQHDYKNVFSGMYLQATKGNIAAVEEYLSKNILSLDTKLQTTLKQQQQLGNIHLIEIKSLLLTKIIYAQSKEIQLNIEVAPPMSRLTMETADFLRILGIAMDNAIEAAIEVREHSTVHLLIMTEKEYVEVVIKNPYKQGMDQSRIWDVGYSTKGENRGIGLSTFVEIIDRYPNVLRETEITDDYFIQTIFLQG